MFSVISVAEHEADNLRSRRSKDPDTDSNQKDRPHAVCAGKTVAKLENSLWKILKGTKKGRKMKINYNNDNKKKHIV